MIFTLEALNAKHGDSLLLHFGTPAKPRLALIDGGPNGVWQGPLRSRLEALRAVRGDGSRPLPIDVAMVSHIDDDHIKGLLDMTRELRRRKDDGEALLWDILRLWHNHFEKLLGDGNSAAVLAAAAGRPATASFDTIAAALHLQGSVSAVVASVNQGRTLASDADYLSISLNPGFGGGLVRTSGDTPRTVKMGGMEWVILGPSEDRLDALRTEWRKVVQERSAAADWSAHVAAFLDRSVFNLSSLIVLARCGGRTILLTGDARGDDVEEALDRAGMLEDGAAHFDVLKVPHHGSDRNVTEDFFGRITADHYVISADGKHGNPDPPMLRMLTRARKKSRYQIHLTNGVPHALEVLQEMKTGRSFKVVVRDVESPSLLVELGDALPADMRP